MAKDAYPFLTCLLILAAILGVVGWWKSAAGCFVLACFVGYFFRDPERRIPDDTDWVVSPADGRIVKIEPSHEPGLGSYRRISIFLSIFDVHINRAPFDGRITEVRYQKGKFLAAFNHRASDENERNSLVIRWRDQTLRVTQIAGLIARRIVCWKKVGETIGRGERFGLIRFGSRVDLDLPEGFEVSVRVGDRVRGGHSVVGRWRGADPDGS